MRDLFYFGEDIVDDYYFNCKCAFQEELDAVYSSLSPIRDLSYGICDACIKLD